MQNRTDDELKQIALDFYKGLIFTDRHVEDAKDLGGVFLVFNFMEAEQLDALRKDPPGLIFEYLSKAGPLAVNGLPMFFSARMLSQSDTDKVIEIVRKLDQAEKNALAGETLKPEEQPNHD